MIEYSHTCCHDYSCGDTIFFRVYVTIILSLLRENDTYQMLPVYAADQKSGTNSLENNSL